MQPASVYVTLLLCILPALANVEKTVFLAPPAIPVPPDHPNLDDLQLEVLSPRQSSVRLHLDAAFPSAENPKGVESWYLLDNLKQGQRHEVRICWSATVSQTHTCPPALPPAASFPHRPMHSRTASAYFVVYSIPQS